VTLSFDLSGLLADKKAAYEFLREYTGLEIADNIRRLREGSGLTQTQLAEALNTTQSVVARLEDEDYRRYSLTTLQKVAEAFDVWPTIVFEPFRGVIHRIVVNARPVIQSSAETLAWANIQPFSDQWAGQTVIAAAPMAQRGVETLAWQTSYRWQFIPVAASLNFDVGLIVKTNEPQVQELSLPSPAPDVRAAAEYREVA
jgi:transcriptional regulator with XRE-family HTH domain